MRFETRDGGELFLPVELVDQLDDHLSRGRYLAAVRVLIGWQDRSGGSDQELLEIVEQRRRHWWPGSHSPLTDD